MTNNTLSVGDRIDARCTKCRKITNHTLVAMVEEKPARVKCNTCGGEHNYRAPRAAAKSKSDTSAPKKAARVSKAKSDPREAERKEWESLRLDMRSSKAIDYAMNGEFEVDTLINHQVFGLGLVQQLCGPRKILVLFQDGKKLMRCA
jgi:hypothetical protein